MWQWQGKTSLQKAGTFSGSGASQLRVDCHPPELENGWGAGGWRVSEVVGVEGAEREQRKMKRTV